MTKYPSWIGFLKSPLVDERNADGHALRHGEIPHFSISHA